MTHLNQFLWLDTQSRELFNCYCNLSFPRFIAETLRFISNKFWIFQKRNLISLQKDLDETEIRRLKAMPLSRDQTLSLFFRNFHVDVFCVLIESFCSGFRKEKCWNPMKTKLFCEGDCSLRYLYVVLSQTIKTIILTFYVCSRSSIIGGGGILPTRIVRWASVEFLCPTCELSKLIRE